VNLVSELICVVCLMFFLSIMTGILVFFSPKKFIYSRRIFSALFFSTLLWLIGVTSNLIVVAANGGKMPVLIEVVGGEEERARAQILVKKSPKHDFLTEQTKFPILADRIRLRLGNYGSIKSIGDLIINISTLGLVVVIMLMLVFGSKMRLELNADDNISPP